MKNLLKKSLISFFSVWISAMVLLFVIAFSSCSSTKKVEKTKVNESVISTSKSNNDQIKNESLKVTDKTEKVTDKSLNQIENETNELETRINEYDTDKPIVPGTNKPPLKKEKIITNKKLSKKDTKSLDNSTEKTTSDAVYTSQLEASMKLLISQNAKLIAETNSKETTTFPFWKCAFITTCILALLYALTEYGAWPKLFVWVLKIFRVRTK
jgi:flagellum-specific peptidoglycan hydrolase FlgJ